MSRIPSRSLPDRSSPATAPEVPRATRATAPGWRDPRLWVGVVLVAGSVVAGSRLLAGADELTPVWSTSADLAVGETLDAADLVAARVRFADTDDRGRYLPVEEELPDALVLTRPLVAGELVPAAALGEAPDASTVSVSVSVPAEHVPTGLARGSHVDVWVIDDGTGRRGREASLVLDDVAVLDAPVTTDAFASATTRQLVLGVPADDEESLGAVLAASGDDRVRVVGRG